MADRKFQIEVSSTFNPTGTQQASAALTDVGKATTKLGEANEEGAKNAEHSGISHRALHQILHLIARESGPGAGAALAGIGAVGGGGIMIGIMAAKELVEWLHQAREEGKRLKEALEAPIDLSGMVNGIQSVKEAVDKTSADIEKFFEKLERKADGHQFKKMADEQIAHLQRVEEAEKKLAEGEATRQKARLEMLKATHQISDEDYRAGVAAVDAMKSQKESAAADKFNSKSTEALQQVLLQIVAKMEAAARELQGQQGKADPTKHIETLSKLYEANQKRIEKLEELQKETPGRGAAFLNAFQHPTESVEEFRARISDEIGGQMNAARAQEASLRKQMGEARANGPDSGKIKELEEQLSGLGSDRTSIESELSKREDQGAVNRDAGTADFVQRFMEAQRHLSSHQGTAQDSQIIDAMNKLLQTTKKSDQHMFLLLQDLIKHKGDLTAALADLARQESQRPVMRGSTTGQ